jgi:hypothetical protein
LWGYISITHISIGRCLTIVISDFFERVDPGADRRIKGLRLVTAYGLAALLATVPQISYGHAAILGPLAGGFALWASVSEAQGTRYESARDLVLLCVSAGIGALSFAVLAHILGSAWAELTLVSGSFCVGFFRRFGILGAGIGSQIFIGQLLAYNAGITSDDVGTIALAAVLAVLASVVPRILSGPAEQPAVTPSLPTEDATIFSETFMGLQAAIASLSIVALGHLVGLTESAWAITACTYVVANSAAGTIDRVRRRIVGTLIGVPLGLLCLPVAAHMPLLIWSAAAVAMIIYAMALPEHYDFASGAYAFALIVTMAASGQYPLATLFARAWETIVGGALGIAIVLFLAPLPNWLGFKTMRGR